MKVTSYGRSTAAEPRRSALCLCGGGITGALFEAGVLAALDDVLGRPASTQFDVYVGSSAGASVGSVVAQGIPADRAFRALRDADHDPFFPLRREDVYQIDPWPWVRSAATIARAALGIALGRGRREERVADDLLSLEELLPAGLFSLRGYISFLDGFFRRERLATRFADLATELYVVANDVDSAERVVFGESDHRDVDIATAIAASSAIPMFFEPVRIGTRDYFDGGIGRVAHLDVAIRHGATRILVVNPIVPIENHVDNVCLPSRSGHCARLAEKGFLCVLNQASRISSKSRLHFGIKRYLADHPEVEVTLIEPAGNETLLFVNGHMGLGARREILEWARSAGREALAPLPAGRINRPCRLRRPVRCSKRLARE